MLAGESAGMKLNVTAVRGAPQGETPASGTRAVMTILPGVPMGMSTQLGAVSGIGIGGDTTLPIGVLDTLPVSELELEFSGFELYGLECSVESEPGLVTAPPQPRRTIRDATRTRETITPFSCAT